MAIMIAQLPPILTTRRVLELADCSRSTLDRSGIKPIGRRGGTLTWRTEDILNWLQGKKAG